MSTEAIIGIIAVFLTFVGIVGKVMGDMKNEIRIATTIQVETKGQLQMIGYRLDNVEKVVTKLDNTFDDLSRYMSSNSDWQVRKHQ